MKRLRRGGIRISGNKTHSTESNKKSGVKGRGGEEAERVTSPKRAASNTKVDSGSLSHTTSPPQRGFSGGVWTVSGTYQSKMTVSSSPFALYDKGYSSSTTGLGATPPPRGSRTKTTARCQSPVAEITASPSRGTARNDQSGGLAKVGHSSEETENQRPVVSSYRIKAVNTKFTPASEGYMRQTSSQSHATVLFRAT